MPQVLSEPTLSPYWDREAAYSYYDHGPLAKTVLGEQEVQGLDYVYTLQGWIKGVNSNTLDPTRDPGKDGTYVLSSRVARDVAGFSLHYNTTDYTPIVSGNSSFVAAQASSDLVNTNNSKDLYNGNIARMITTITDPTTRDILPMGNAYLYDQLNRLLTSRSFDNIDSTTNAWGSGGTQRYRNNFTYDANGNIKTQTRKDYAGTGVIDSLAYKYEEVGGEKVRNRLYHVDDSQTNTALFTDDIDDMGTFVTGAAINTSNNYSYDEEGRLIKDVQEGIASIVWRVDGKVKSIIRPSGSSKKNITFDYDAMGHRIAKHIYTSAGVLEQSTYYILDAQGNTMSTYDRQIISSTVYFSQKEKYIYGISRLGVFNDSLPLLGSQNSTYSQTTWTHAIGKRNYELNNHLGNVLSVISDKVLLKDAGTYNTSTGVYISATLDGKTDWFIADILQSNDYSAFGVQLNERSFKKGGFNRKTKRGFNGMEMDNEIHPGSDGLAEGDSYDFGARFHDPRLGRFLSIDPKSSRYPSMSTYCFAGNIPTSFSDENGEGPIIGWHLKSMEKDKKNKVYTISYDLTVTRDFTLVNMSSLALNSAEGLAIAKDIAGKWGGSDFSYHIDAATADQSMLDYQIRKQYTHIPKDYKLAFDVKVTFITGYISYQATTDPSSINTNATLIGIVDEISGSPVGGGDAVGWASGSDAIIVEKGYISPTKKTLESGVELQSYTAAVHETLHEDGATDTYTVDTQGCGIMGKAGTSLTLCDGTQKEMAISLLRQARAGHNVLMDEAEPYLSKTYSSVINHKWYQKMVKSGKAPYGKVQEDPNPKKTNGQSLKDLKNEHT